MFNCCVLEANDEAETLVGMILKYLVIMVIMIHEYMHITTYRMWYIAYVSDETI